MLIRYLPPSELAPHHRHIVYADSLYEAINHIRTVPRLWGINQSRTNPASHTWDDGVGWHGAVRLATGGWSHGAEKVHETLKLVVPPVTKHAAISMDVAGHYPDVPRYLTGMPDCMATRGNRRASRPVVSIVANVCANSMTPARNLFNFGAALCALIDQLEANGQRVELARIGYSHTKPPGQTFNSESTFWGWTVKKSGEPLDLYSMAFSLCHPAAQRRIGFALMEYLPKRLESSSYHYPSGGLRLVRRGQSIMHDWEGAIVINAAQGELMDKCNTVDQATKWLKAAIRLGEDGVLETLND